MATFCTNPDQPQHNKLVESNCLWSSSYRRSSSNIQSSVTRCKTAARFSARLRAALAVRCPIDQSKTTQWYCCANKRQATLTPYTPYCEACTQQCAWLLKRLVFAEVGDFTSWYTTMNCYRATIVCLDGKGLWKPGQCFILAGFTLSLPCSAPCGSEQTTIDTGCDPALPRNCVDHPADCNLFKTITSTNLQ